MCRDCGCDQGRQKRMPISTQFSFHNPRRETETHKTTNLFPLFCTRIHQPHRQPKRQNTHTRKFMECQHVFIHVLLFSFFFFFFYFQPCCFPLYLVLFPFHRKKAYDGPRLSVNTLPQLLSPGECSDPWPLHTFSLWKMTLSSTRLAGGSGTGEPLDSLVSVRIVFVVVWRQNGPVIIPIPRVSLPKTTHGRG